MRHYLLAVAMLIAAPVAGGAQIVSGSIDPGMSRAQVIERLGTPASERAMNGFTYLLYENGCERICGMSDLVTLQGDSVVDAIFRAPARQYTGESSSPVQGTYGPTRLASDDGRSQRSPRRGSGAFALPAEWTGGSATPLAVTVDSIVLQVTAAPTPARESGRKSVLPAEWLDATAGAAAPPPADAAPPARPDSARKPSSVLPAEWLDPSATPAVAPEPARAKVKTTLTPPAEPPRKSVLPTEWLDPSATSAVTPPPAGATPPVSPAPAQRRQSVLPAEWLDPAAAGASTPSARQAPPAPRPEATRKPLIPTEWLNPASARPDSARPPAVNPPPAPPPGPTP